MRRNHSPEIHKYTNHTAWAFSDVVLGEDGMFYTAYRRDDQTISVHARSQDRWFPLARLTLEQAGATRFLEGLGLAVDRSGGIHLAYLFERGEAAGVGYARHDGHWHCRAVGRADPPADGRFGEPALTLDRDGRAHIAYAYGDAQVSEVRYASQETDWLPVIGACVPAQDADTLRHPWICLDGGGDLHLLYIDGADNLYCRTRRSGAPGWDSAQLAVGASGTGTSYVYQKPILDHDGRVHVLYTHDELDPCGHVATSTVASFVRDAGSWTRQVVVGTDRHMLYAWPVMDAAGRAHALVERWLPDQSRPVGADAYPLGPSAAFPARPAPPPSAPDAIAPPR